MTGADVGIRLPRDVENGPRADAVRTALAEDRRPLWSGGSLQVSYVQLTATMRERLGVLGNGKRIARGLEAAESLLAGERRGLDALPAEVRSRQGTRVSRVLLVSDDGAERFYRQVERVAAAHAPRVLVCRVACTGAELGASAFGAGEVAKLVLTAHKSAAAEILEALAAV